MSLYGDLHVELEMSILDRSYGGLKRSIKCRSFGVPLSIFMAGSTIDPVDVVSIWCRYGVDGVEGGGLPVDYYVLDAVWSRLWAPLATEGQVQRLYELGMAYCNYLMLSCHLPEFASGHSSLPIVYG
jgi:hypothetical protein